MRKAIRTALLLLLLLIPATAVHAEDASHLLRKYGLSVSDPLVEGEKLAVLESEYSATARQVNNQTMLSAASELAERYYERGLIERDSAIYALADSLQAVQLKMDANLEADVATILKLDAEYRSIAGELQRQREARRKWLDQAKAEYEPPSAELEQNRIKLDRLGREVDKQREKYERALSYPELGTVNDFRSPLEIPAAVTSPFGERLDPITRDAITFHRGADLSAPIGTAVLAAFHGEVEEASETEELGYYIVLNHGYGIKTLYGHLDRILVEKGQRVEQYEAIAKSGNTGARTTGPHLHFGLYINGKAVDPAILLF
ncbi:peptidoglycan DD-metalloendopeptidase family protein [Paenibacillaceae bacterium WGS1546]|uniref:M23 family metallopeptidase n=1 Tax=Cohnella sp. WGS1546 TaxID=3366810 RepID=UPI00372D825A